MICVKKIVNIIKRLIQTQEMNRNFQLKGHILPERVISLLKQSVLWLRKVHSWSIYFLCLEYVNLYHACTSRVAIILRLFKDQYNNYGLHSEEKKSPNMRHFLPQCTILRISNIPYYLHKNEPTSDWWTCGLNCVMYEAHQPTNDKYRHFTPSLKHVHPKDVVS